jgi:hypothetical protein
MTRQAVQVNPNSDNVPPTIRKERDLIFEFIVQRGPGVAATNPNAPPSVVRFDRPLYPELPVEKSDTILVARLEGLTPHLLGNRRGIYTEYRFAVLDPLRALLLYKNDNIDVVELGGVMRLADGRDFRQLASGLGGQLEINSTYSF